jgi:Tfp pilus assembly protein PilO
MVTTKPITKWTSQEVLMYLQKLDRESWIRLLLALLGCLLFFFFIFWPAWLKRPFLQGRIQMLRGQIQVAQAKIAQEPQLEVERKEHEAFVESVQDRLLREREGEGIVGILAGLAEKSQVALLSTEPQEQDDRGAEKIPAPFDSKYRRISYLLTVEGGYHQLATLVSNIENHSKIFRVAEFSVTPREETPSVHLGQILVSAFALKEGRKGAT